MSDGSQTVWSTLNFINSKSVTFSLGIDADGGGDTFPYTVSENIITLDTFNDMGFNLKFKKNGDYIYMDFGQFNPGMAGVIFKYIQQ